MTPDDLPHFSITDWIRDSASVLRAAHTHGYAKVFGPEPDCALLVTITAPSRQTGDPSHGLYTCEACGFSYPIAGLELDLTPDTLATEQPTSNACCTARTDRKPG